MQGLATYSPVDRSSLHEKWGMAACGSRDIFSALLCALLCCVLLIPLTVPQPSLLYALCPTTAVSTYLYQRYNRAALHLEEPSDMQVSTSSRYADCSGGFCCEHLKSFQCAPCSQSILISYYKTPFTISHYSSVCLFIF